MCCNILIYYLIQFLANDILLIDRVLPYAHGFLEIKIRLLGTTTVQSCFLIWYFWSVKIIKANPIQIMKNHNYENKIQKDMFNPETTKTYERPPKPPTFWNSYTRTLILDTIMKLSGTIGVTQKTMTLDTHVRLILLQTLNPQERWGTHKKRWPFQPRLFAGVIGLVRCSYECFLKWWYPQNTPKWSFLVGKPMVVGYHILGNPHILNSTYMAFYLTQMMPRPTSRGIIADRLMKLWTFRDGKRWFTYSGGYSALEADV